MSDVWLISYLALWVFAVIQGIVIIALLRGFAGLHQRLEEQQESGGIMRLTPGSVLADQDLRSISGGTTKLSRLWQRGNLLLLFVSVDCVPCRSLLTWIGDALRNNQLSDWDVCVLCAGDEAEVRKLFSEIEFPPEILVAAVDYALLKSRYQIPGTPTVAIVEENGHVVDVVVGEIQSYLEILTRRSEFKVLVSPGK